MPETSLCIYTTVACLHFNLYSGGKGPVPPLDGEEYPLVEGVICSGAPPQLIQLLVLERSEIFGTLYVGRGLRCLSSCYLN